MTARMVLPRNLIRAGLLLAAFVPGCAREPKDGERGSAAAAAEPALTVERMERPSPSAAAVEAFAAICAAEPARNPVARAAARRGFAPVPLAALREEMPSSAALPADAAAWRGPDEAGSPVLLWDGATATCELRARSVDPLVVEAEFAKLPQAFEDAGASVMRLQAPTPARAGAPRTRQMLLVSPGRAPERARVLRLGDDGAGGGRDAVVLTARGVAAGR